MPLRPIVRYPDPRLKQLCRPVELHELPGLRQLVNDMAETMFAAHGAGLAAIQVGEPLRVFIVDAEIAGRPPTDPPLAFINPELVLLGGATELTEEGCLSFPGIYVPIERALRCRARALDLDGQPFEVEGEALFARAMQHENDHLNGRLLADYVGRLKRKMIERRLQRGDVEDDGR
ncbi:MAG: peptide deformylase [Proteobacteria bacterium]|nr:peptide deformylase [Pseudomonadota bacterium]